MVGHPSSTVAPYVRQPLAMVRRLMRSATESHKPSQTKPSEPRLSFEAGTSLVAARHTGLNMSFYQ